MPRPEAGLIPNFTGISDPYEAPTNAELTIDTTAVSNAAAVERLFNYLASGGWLQNGGPLTIDWLLVAAAFGIGIVVGLTGMGGGALMTPVLVLVFGDPAAGRRLQRPRRAAVMKPDRRHRPPAPRHREPGAGQVAVLGSVPAAFRGVFVLRSLGDGRGRSGRPSRSALGVALLIAAFGLAFGPTPELARAGPSPRRPRRPRIPRNVRQVVIRKLPTILVGGARGARRRDDVGGLGIAHHHRPDGALSRSQGQSARRTDLVQAVPLVAAAAVAHIFFGDFQFALTTSLLIGCVPGAWVGARLSSRAPGGFIRRVLAFVLLASALKLLGLGTAPTGIVLLASLLVAPTVWMVVRRANGFPALARSQRQANARAASDVGNNPQTAAR